MSSNRFHHTLPRDLEFATEGELSKRMGVSPHLWFDAVLKELFDNALDACEEGGIEPEIKVDSDAHGWVTVADNGPGIPPEIVRSIATWDRRTSSREAYCDPSRGQQGNALQAIACLPLGLGQDHSIMRIKSQGVHHTIQLTVNRLVGKVEVDHREERCDVSSGTEVSILWPRSDLDFSILGDIVTLNPHMALTFRGDRYPVRGPVSKWTPDSLLPAHWYSLERFGHRILAELRRDPEVTVAQFMGTFKGMTDRSRRARIAEALDLTARPLSAVLEDCGTKVNATLARRLLLRMQNETKPPRAALLGQVGKEHVLAWASDRDMGEEGAPIGFAYNIIEGVDWRWEIAFGYRPDLTGRQLLFGQNFSPLLDPDTALHGIMGHAYLLGPYEPITLFLHRISPTRINVDYGKSKLNIANQERYPVAEALNKLSKKWVRQRESEIGGRRSARERAQRMRGERPKRITIRDAVFACLPEAYQEASSAGKFAVLVRQIFYRLRPRVLAITGKETLRDSYVTTQLIPEYLLLNPDLKWRVLYDSRGVLTVPHTRSLIPLGTVGVTAYHQNGHIRYDFDPDCDWKEWEPEISGALNRYSAVIVVEKEGVADLLLEDGLPERRDVAIIASKGQPTESVLKLLDKISVPVFTLHDFDRTGMTIGENLRRGTWRHQYTSEFPVVEIGLRLHQIDGLESEPIDDRNLKSVSDVRLRECGATEDEIEFLSGRRVELNALTTERLVGLVDDALDDYGIEKVIPSIEAIRNAWRSAGAHAELMTRMKELMPAVDERWRDAEPPPDLVGQIARRLEENPGSCWDTALKAIMNGD